MMIFLRNLIQRNIMSQKYLLKKIFLSRGHRVHGCEKRKTNVPYFFSQNLNSRLCGVQIYEKCCINLVSHTFNKMIVLD